MSDTKQPGAKNPCPGVFITKGMRITVSNLSMRIGPDGSVASSLTLNTGLDLCPYWLDIAYGHLLNTENASQDLLRARDARDDRGIGDALHAEFVSGMQTIMASAVAMDAYYACVKDLIQLPAGLTESWWKNKTARDRQIAEVLRRAFRMSEDEARQLCGILKETMSFRDKAVHPPAGTTSPALHPELNKLTDWRFVAFRFYNAKAIAGTTLQIVAQTAGQLPKSGARKLIEYCETIMVKVQPMVERWEARYGRLFE